MVGALSFCAATSQAATIASTFGPPGSLYLTNSFPLAVGNATFGPDNVHVAPATKFTIPQGVWDVTQVNVPVKNISGPANAIFIIAVDNGGTPGAYYWNSSVLSNIPAEDNVCCAVTTVNLAPGTLLLSSFANADYWLIVGPGNVTNTDVWELSPGGGAYGYYHTDTQVWDLGLTTNVGAFSITGTNLLDPQPSVPEPGSLMLLASVFVGFAVFRLRK